MAQPRAVEYEFNFEKKQAKLVWEFRSSLRFNTSGGSVQRLSNGNTLIGWGMEKKYTSKNIAYIIATEVSPDKKIVREIISDKDLESYRVFFNEYPNKI